MLKPRRSLSTLVTGLLTLSLSVILFGGGCCSSGSTPTQPPTIPAGRPRDRTLELIERFGTDSGWDDSDVEFLLRDRLEWRAWAEALERAWPRRDAK